MRFDNRAEVIEFNVKSVLARAPLHALALMRIALHSFLLNKGGTNLLGFRSRNTGKWRHPTKTKAKKKIDLDSNPMVLKVPLEVRTSSSLEKASRASTMATVVIGLHAKRLDVNGGRLSFSIRKIRPRPFQVNRESINVTVLITAKYPQSSQKARSCAFIVLAFLFDKNIPNTL